MQATQAVLWGIGYYARRSPACRATGLDRRFLVRSGMYVWLQLATRLLEIFQVVPTIVLKMFLIIASLLESTSEVSWGVRGICRYSFCGEGFCLGRHVSRPRVEGSSWTGLRAQETRFPGCATNVSDQMRGYSYVQSIRSGSECGSEVYQKGGCSYVHSIRSAFALKWKHDLVALTGRSTVWAWSNVPCTKDAYSCSDCRRREKRRD